MRTDPAFRIRLPTGGWQVGFRIQSDGRTVIDVTDPAGSPLGMIATVHIPFLWIDAGWAGRTRSPGGGTQWWALAIGHAPTDACQPRVTFTRRRRHSRRGRMELPQETVDGLWIVHHGLWVAAGVGRYTHVRLTALSATRVQRLRLAIDRPDDAPI